MSLMSQKSPTYGGLILANQVHAVWLKYPLAAEKVSNFKLNI
jgi:hypothetical protein